MPEEAPIMTPPVNEAFSISFIYNFRRSNELTIKVPKQLPVREIMVFTITILFS